MSNIFNESRYETTVKMLTKISQSKIILSAHFPQTPPTKPRYTNLHMLIPKLCKSRMDFNPLFVLLLM